MDENFFSLLSGGGERDTHSFAGGFDFQGAFFGGNHFAGVSDHLIDFGVVVLGVVMEEEEAFHVGLQGEFDDVIDAAVTPAPMLSVFVAIVLRVHDEHVDAFDEFGNFAIFVAGKFKFGGVAAATELGIMTMAEVRFVVREESDGAAGCV